MSVAFNVNEHHVSIQKLINTDWNATHFSIFISFNECDHRDWVHIRLKKIKRTIKDLNRSFSNKFLDDLIDPLARILRTANSKKYRGIAIFRTLDKLHYRFLLNDPKNFVVVANSFHIRPILEQPIADLSCLAVLVDQQKITVYEINDETIVPIFLVGLDQKEMVQKDDLNKQKRQNKIKIFREQQVKLAFRQLKSQVNLHQKSIAILGPRPMRKEFEKECDLLGAGQIFYQGEMISSLESLKRTLMPRLMQVAKQQNTLRSESIKARAMINPEKAHNLQEIAKAAVAGRVAKLLVENAPRVWGHLNRQTGLLKTHPKQENSKDDCVVDDISEEVLRYGGQVLFQNSRSKRLPPKFTAILRW